MQTEVRHGQQHNRTREEIQENSEAGEGSAPPQIQIQRTYTGPVREHRELPFALESEAWSEPKPARRAHEYALAQHEV